MFLKILFQLKICITNLLHLLNYGLNIIFIAQMLFISNGFLDLVDTVGIELHEHGRLFLLLPNAVEHFLHHVFREEPTLQQILPAGQVHVLLVADAFLPVERER